LANVILGKKVDDLPGADLSGFLQHPHTHPHIVEPDGQPREGVLFVTDDNITVPLSDNYGNDNFQYFCENVEALRALIANDQENLPPGVKREFLPRALAPGGVAQPNHVQCIRTADWKLSRYWDPSGQETDQWEMYDLNADTRERINLLTWENGEPILNDAGKANPQAAAALPALLNLLNQKLTAAGYPEPFLHTVSAPMHKTAK
jgi:hypothetical protein